MYISLAVFTVLTIITETNSDAVWKYGRNVEDSILAIEKAGKIRLFEKHVKVPLYVNPCLKIVFVRVRVYNILSTPSVTYDRQLKTVNIDYDIYQSSSSQYEIMAKVVPVLPCHKKRHKKQDNENALPEDNVGEGQKQARKMHPRREQYCDALLEHPALATPPPEPERPRPPRVRRPRVFKIAERFPLLDPEFYAVWVNHQKELQLSKPKIDNRPPGLFPELYLKPRRLNYYSRQLEENMIVNKNLLKRINLIQRTGGYVDCWLRPVPDDKHNKLLCRRRQRLLDEIYRQNSYFYTRLLTARSEQPITSELEKLWEDTKHKLILGASLPFILFKTEKIDRDIKDPAFDKPPGITRTKITLDIWVHAGAKMGYVTVELFNEIVPKTCQLFMSLLKGEPSGHAYAGTRIFRIVPDLYCRGGDVIKDNGFGCYVPAGQTDPMPPENFNLKHSVPGVLSMVVNSDHEVTGQFNIIFKPLPQLDGKHVVFGRIIAGPALTLERISALGHPKGTTSADVVFKSCGWYTRSGHHKEGNRNTIKFHKKR